MRAARFREAKVKLGAALGGALVLGACGGNTDSNASGTAGGKGGVEASAAAGGQSPGQAGKTGTGASSSSGSGGAAGEPTSACARPEDAAPGKPVYTEMAAGTGECRGTALAGVLAQIRELRPDLDDVQTLYVPDPERGGDGSFVYAFQREDGGFAVALKRGGGDCPAGCTINDYWYFETGAGCVVREVGEAHRDYEHCMQPDQLPRWGIPRAAMPSEICDVDLAPQDLTGDHLLVTCGQAEACALSGEKPTTEPLPAFLQLTIVQDADNLARGRVWFHGTGDSVLDGRAFDASFERRRVHVSAQSEPLPSTCIDTWALTFDYDFEGLGRSQLLFDMARTPNCAERPGDYCKGQIKADFAPPSSSAQ